MKKGLEGHSLVILMTLIVAMIGLVLLWMFVFSTQKEGANYVKDFVSGLKDMIPTSVKVLMPGV